MTTHVLEDRRTLGFSCAIIAVLFVAANLPLQLDDYDQAKQAYASFEVVNAGHWLYQHTPHERIATKPPLVGWISAGIFAVTRSWEIAWRLPSLLAAAGLSILLFRAASVAYGPAAGLIALSAFGLNLLTPRLATLVRTDMPVALAIFAIGLVIWGKIRTRMPWTTRDRLSMFALLAAALLIKGPIVYAFLLPGVAVATLCERHKFFTRVATVADCRYNLDAWFGWWPWLASLAIFLLWVIGGILFQSGFYDQVILREFLGRFGETVHRPQPIYFYVPHLLHKFAPWSLLMIAIIVFDVRNRRPKLDGLKPLSLTSDRPRRISPETLWLICWSLGGLVVMSLIPSKRVDRIFPVIPPLCLLLAAQLGAGRENESRQKRVWLSSAAALALSILFTTIYTGIKITTGYRQHRGALVQFGGQVRAEADKHRWRYEVVSAGDEGLLLYLHRLHFVNPEQAVAEWNRGNIDAVIVAEDAVPNLLHQLHDAALSQLRSPPNGNNKTVYVVLRR
jgi:4-amino-4-deoxy-L-arabinose transferase-like glycosyltransferase